MKYISECKAGAVVFFACLLAMNLVIAAPKSQGGSESPLGTWTQQGTDLNGDGVLSGEENDTVFIFYSVNGATVSFNLHVEGGCNVAMVPCQTGPGGVSDYGCMNIIPAYVPGFKRRMQYPTSGSLGVRCDQGCPEECAFTINDVR